MPLSNLSVFGHGEVKSEPYGWRLVVLAGIMLFPAMAIFSVAGDGSFSILPLLAFVAMIVYKLVAKPETGLVLTTNSGYSRLFVSKNHEALARITEQVFSILEDPERYASRTYQVSINGSQISGNFIVGDASGSVTNRANTIDLGAHDPGARGAPGAGAVDYPPPPPSQGSH
jgi:hypothetical protein